MVKLKDINKPLQQGKRNISQSSIEERWKEDAEWFKEDAKKHPEKYRSKNDEVPVSSKELEGYLENFIKEENTSYSAEGRPAYIRPRMGGALSHKARMRALARSRNNRLQNTTRRYSKKK